MKIVSSHHFKYITFHNLIFFQWCLYTKKTDDMFDKCDKCLINCVAPIVICLIKIS